MKYFLTILFSIIIPLTVFSQNTSVLVNPTLPVPKVNTPTIPEQNGHNYFPDNQQGQTPYIPVDPQQTNRIIMEEVRQFEAHMQRTQNEREFNYMLKNGFRSLAGEKGTEHFYSAFNEINQMLSGEIPMNLGRAIFLVENAYYEGQLNYNDFQQSIKRHTELCNMKIKEEKRNPNDNLTKNLMLFRYITEPLEIKIKGLEKPLQTSPVKYDYEDFKSEKSYDSHFVTKLMRTNEGQCNSMPLFYLILAEEIGAEAYWAFSPRHSFVKIKDDEGNWYNMELTNGYMMSDAHYMNNSYIKAEALQNRIYMEPMDKEQIISEMLINLAMGYYEKHGFDDFTLQCASKAKEHLERPLNALMLESAYQTRLTLVFGHLLGAKNPEIMKQKSPEAYQHFLKMQEQYREIDATGYEDLPDTLYEKWLEYIASEKEKAKVNNTLLLKMD